MPFPAPRTPDPMAAPALRWGVVGSGWIAERFTGSVQRHTRQQILAVGSRDAGRAAAFAATHGIERSYGSYEQLVADPEDFGESFAADHRILRADLAGGPMLDLGTYPVSFALWVLGAPQQVAAGGQPHPAGVNGQVSAILADAHGNQAVLHTTVFSDTPTTATIAGTEATLTLAGPFYQPGDMVLTYADGRASSYTEPPVAHDALSFEAAEVARRIAAGELESSLRPLADSVATLAAMDEIRRQCGITFP